MQLHARQASGLQTGLACQPGDVHGPNRSAIRELNLLRLIAGSVFLHQRVIGWQIVAAKGCPQSIVRVRNL